MILPVGIRNEEKVAKSHYAAAPSHPQIKRKLWMTTCISLPISAFIYWLFTSGALDGVL